MAWTDEQKQRAIDLYMEGEPTAANSAEICKSIADELEQSANGVRLVLVQAGVYVKQATAAASATKTGTAKKEGEGTKRLSKDDQIAELRAAIVEKGGDVDDEILSKLTGKAAAYFTKVISG